MNEKTIQPNQTYVSGRIDHTGMLKDKHQTRLIIPAKDSFSMPSSVTISSKQRLGNVGDDLNNVLCSLAGIPKEFKNRDNEMVFNSNMWLEQVA